MHYQQSPEPRSRSCIQLFTAPRRKADAVKDLEYLVWLCNTNGSIPTDPPATKPPKVVRNVK